MKKYPVIILIIILFFTLAACRHENSVIKNSKNIYTPDITPSATPAQTVEPKETPIPPIAADEELPLMNDQDLIKKVDGLCKDYFDQKNYVGMAVGIIKNGKVAYLNYGSTKKKADPINENTIFEIASMSKTFTGTMLGDLVINNKLSLDDEVQKFFPDIKISTYNKVPMKLIHLATHTSGLPRMPENYTGNNNIFCGYNEEMLLSFLDEYKLTREPGITYEYSNLGVGLLGYILSKVENEPYNQLLQEMICNKLGMKSTSVSLTDEQHKRKASPYNSDSSPSEEWDFDVLEGCGGINSTTRDLLRFIAANIGYIQIDSGLSDKSLSDAMMFAQKMHDKQNSMGLCWQIKYTNNACWHNGLVGGYSSYYIFDPNLRIGTVILCNNADSVMALGDNIMTLIELSLD